MAKARKEIPKTFEYPTDWDDNRFYQNELLKKPKVPNTLKAAPDNWGWDTDMPGKWRQVVHTMNSAKSLAVLAAIKPDAGWCIEGSEKEKEKKDKGKKEHGQGSAGTRWHGSRAGTRAMTHAVAAQANRGKEKEGKQKKPPAKPESPNRVQRGIVVRAQIHPEPRHPPPAAATVTRLPDQRR